LTASEARTALSERATALLRRIHQSRDLGQPGNSPYCVLEAGSTYVQALARPACSTIELEAVSGRSWPAVGAILTPERIRLLAELGFEPPGPRSPNYLQDVEIVGGDDLDRAGGLMARVLIDVYGVNPCAAIEATLSVPKPQGDPISRQDSA